MIIGRVEVIITALLVEMPSIAVSAEALEALPTTMVPFTMFLRKSITGYCGVFR